MEVSNPSCRAGSASARHLPSVSRSLASGEVCNAADGCAERLGFER